MTAFLLSSAVGCSRSADGPGAPPTDAPPVSDTASGTTGGPAATSGATATTGTTGGPATTADTGPAEPPPPASNRDRLLLGYLAYLRLDPTNAQTNGLRGADLADVCELWDALDPSSRGTFLTITARLEGSILAVDGSTMLDHVTTAYRVVGGEGATATDAGSCGGGESNRLVMSMDAVLQDALVQAYRNRGRPGRSGRPDIADIPPGGVWRDTHDLGGPHAPFTMSDETEDGAPRGQVHFFADPTSAAAQRPLGRRDLERLVDPYALEMDQDYDCVHSSNPGCVYTLYGPLCLPEAPTLGADLYTRNYGSFDPGWRPTGC